MICRWCKGESPASTSILQRPDGSYTGDAAEIGAILRRSWDPIFAMYAKGGEPSWERFELRYSDHIKSVPWEVSDMTGEELRVLLGRMSGSSCVGIDGWRVEELKRLPTEILDMLADIFNLVEKLGKWPLSLQRALVTLIPKGQGCQPLDLRPITVMSVIYRLWAVRRLQDLKAWQEKTLLV